MYLDIAQNYDVSKNVTIQGLKVDLRSDTLTLPSQEMKKFMMEAPLGDDVYQEDPTVSGKLTLY